MKRSYPVVVALILASFCGGYLLNQRGSERLEGTGDRKVLYYVDPMNPGIRSDRPGTAPCGMPLEPVYAEDGDSAKDSSLPPGTVRVTPERQQLIGVKVASVERAPLKHNIRALGRVVPDETRIYRINAATDGWVKRMLPATTDSLVEKDELLAAFYAPEFFSAMKAYLYGLRALDRFEASTQETKEQLELTGANIENYRNALRNLGMTDHQLDEIMQTRQGASHVEIRAPAPGFIVARNITLGQRFEKGTELYRIADLSKIWIVVDTFDTEALSFRPGVAVAVFAPNLKTTFTARVAGVPPRFDPTSRTLQVRLEADNPALLLKPDMFVDVELPVALPAAITLPQDALIVTGLAQTVYVDLGNGTFEPRQVTTGGHFGRRVEITGGLMAGEKVVVSGNFLIDSESRLRTIGSRGHSERARDPVCGMFIEQSKAATTGKTKHYRGRTYFFCSDQCGGEFEEQPERYATHEAGEEEHQEHLVEPAMSAGAPQVEGEGRSPVFDTGSGLPSPGLLPPPQRAKQVQESQASSTLSNLPTGSPAAGGRRRRGGPPPGAQPSVSPSSDLPHLTDEHEHLPEGLENPFRNTPGPDHD